MTLPEPLAAKPLSDSAEDTSPRRALSITALVTATITFLFSTYEITAPLLSFGIEPPSRIIGRWVADTADLGGLELLTASNASLVRLLAYIVALLLGIASIHRPHATPLSAIAIGIAATGLLDLLTDALTYLLR